MQFYFHHLVLQSSYQGSYTCMHSTHSSSCILRPPIQPGKYGPELKVVLNALMFKLKM